MDKKKCLLMFTFLILLVSPLKMVYSREATAKKYTYNRYYFFEEPYLFNEPYYQYNGVEQNETTNYAIFAGKPVFDIVGNSEPEPSFVSLYRDSGAAVSGSINTFQDFYDIMYSIQKNENAVYVDVGNGKSCLVYAKDESGKKDSSVINTYYTHSCYKKKLNAEWNSTDANLNEAIIGGQVVTFKACASINRFTNGSVTQIKGDEKYTVFEIKRPKYTIVNREPDNVSEVQINSALGENISGCNPDYDYHVNPYYFKINNINYNIFSPALVKQTYEVVKYDCPSISKKENSGCNTSRVIGDSCDKMTISVGNNNDNSAAKAEFDVSQAGTISNILTPSEIYQGGGINFGFMYHNTFTWKLVDGSFRTYANQEEKREELFKALKEKVLDENKILNNINVDFNISSGVEKLMDVQNNLVKNCKQTMSGQFEEGTITTVCSVFLPVSNVKTYSGEIKNISGIVGDGINNKMYTELDYTGVINLSATISGLNVMKGGKDWQVNINPNNNDKSCQVNVYNRLYAERKSGDKSNRYKFIYRPIDLKNPFPSRSAGPNWYDWYFNNANKNRLESSYSKLQYEVKLNPVRVSEIKKYNQNNPYFNWDSIDEKTGNSSFVKEYFEIKGQNIVGDKS